jgi:hypothetical protein
MAEVVHSCGSNHFQAKTRLHNGRLTDPVFYPMFFPLTTKVDFGLIARLNQTLIQFGKGNITSQQSENLLY